MLPDFCEFQDFPEWRGFHEFPESVLNKTQSLRKKEMVKEAINNLMYLLENHSGHKLMPKAQYMLGDIYMNDLRDFNTAIQEYRKVLEKF